MKKINNLVQEYKDFLDLKKSTNYTINYLSFIIQFIIAFVIITLVYILVGYSSHVLSNINYILYYFIFSCTASYFFAYKKQENKFKKAHKLSVKHIDDSFVNTFNLFSFYVLLNFFLIIFIYKPFISDFEAFLNIGVFIVILIIVFSMLIFFKIKSSKSSYETIYSLRLVSVPLAVKSIIYAALHLVLVLIIPIIDGATILIINSIITIVLLGTSFYIKKIIKTNEMRSILGISLLVSILVVNAITGIVQSSNLNPFKFIGSVPIIQQEIDIDNEEIQSIMFEDDHLYVLTRDKLIIYDKDLTFTKQLDIIEDSFMKMTNHGIRILSYTPDAEIQLESYRPDHTYSLYYLDSNNDLQFEQAIIYPYTQYELLNGTDRQNKSFVYVGDFLLNVEDRYNNAKIYQYNELGGYIVYDTESPYEDIVNDDFALYERNDEIYYFGSFDDYSKDMKQLTDPTRIYSNGMVMENYLHPLIMPIESNITIGYSRVTQLNNIEDISEATTSYGTVEVIDVQSFTKNESFYFISVRQPDGKFDFISYYLNGDFKEYITVSAAAYSIENNTLYIANDTNDGINVSVFNIEKLSESVTKKYISSTKLLNIDTGVLNSTENYMVGTNSIIWVYMELLLVIGLIIVPPREN